MTPTEQRLVHACNGLLGLVQLVAGRADVSDELRDILSSNHRVIEAALAVAAVSGEASAETVIARATGRAT